MCTHFPWRCSSSMKLTHHSQSTVLPPEITPGRACCGQHKAWPKIATKYTTVAFMDFNSLPCDIKPTLWALFTTKWFIFLVWHIRDWIRHQFWKRQWHCMPRFLNSRIPPYLYWAQAVEGKKTHVLFLMHIPTQDQWRLSETQELWLKFSILSRDHPHQSKIKLKLGYSLSPSIPVRNLLMAPMITTWFKSLEPCQIQEFPEQFLLTFTAQGWSTQELCWWQKCRGTAAYLHTS